MRVTGAAGTCCVFGAGAVGSLIAARLADAGQPVTLVARGGRLRDLEAQGLRLHGPDGVRTVGGVSARDAAALGHQDVLLLALKAHAIAPALDDLRRLIGPETLVVPLVNGIPWWYFQPDGMTGVEAVDPGGRIAASIAPDRLVGAVVLVTVSLGSDGAVRPGGPERLAIGRIDGRPDMRVDALAAMLTRCGIETKSTAAIRADLWSKLALNLSSNPLSVVSGATLEEQYGHPGLLPIVRAVLEETLALAAAYGVQPTLSLDQMLAIGRAAGPFQTSMAQDFSRGAPLELGAIGFSALELADRAGVPMPVTRMMVDLAAFRASSRETTASPFG